MNETYILPCGKLRLNLTSSYLEFDNVSKRGCLAQCFCVAKTDLENLSDWELYPKRNDEGEEVPGEYILTPKNDVEVKLQERFCTVRKNKEEVWNCGYAHLLNEVEELKWVQCKTAHYMLKAAADIYKEDGEYDEFGEKVTYLATYMEDSEYTKFDEQFNMNEIHDMLRNLSKLTIDSLPHINPVLVSFCYMLLDEHGYQDLSEKAKKFMQSWPDHSVSSPENMKHSHEEGERR